MSSTEYLFWFLAMAVLIPVIVHGGTTWAYFRGAQQRAGGDTVAADRPGSDQSRAASGPMPSPVRAPSAASEDDRTVPEKQIWRWYDDGGAVAREPGAPMRVKRPD